MIKQIIAGLCLLFSTVMFSQQNNASPYSYYGIGDVKFKGTAENRAMGGIGILPDSIHINLQNPASYSSLKFTTFTIAATTSSTGFKTTEASDRAGRTTLDYIAVAIPYKSLGFSFGLMPYSAVGYKVQNTTAPDPVDGFTRFRQFEGDGGLNRVFGGASYKINKNFSVGADFQYFFGDIETRSLTTLPDASMQYATRELNTSEYDGMSYNVGAMFQTRVSDKYEYYLSATYTPETKLNTTTNRNLATISLNTSGTEIIVDETDIVVGNEDLTLPSKFTAGTGFGQARKWFAGAEYTTQEANQLGARFDGITNTSFEKSQKISVGGYYIPKFNSFTSYLSRMTYRAGFKYEKTGLVIAGQDINDYALTMGIGLPLSSIVGSIGSSNLNIGAEIGRRGTTANGLVEENYVNIFISLSLNDRWFTKRKYD
jgi:long-subunit fatty acid transport protein